MTVEYYSLPLIQKEFKELSRDKILKKRIEYLKENNLLSKEMLWGLSVVSLNTKKITQRITLQVAHF